MRTGSCQGLADASAPFFGWHGLPQNSPCQPNPIGRYPRVLSTRRKFKKRARNWETPTRLHNGQIIWIAHLTEPEYRYNRYNRLKNKQFGPGGTSPDGVAHRLIKHRRDDCKACLPVPNHKPRRGKGSR